MRSLVFYGGLILAFSQLTACASLTVGSNQSISIETPPTQQARCALKNDKGKWYIDNTPGSVVVHRSFKDLDIVCEKQGYQPAHQNAPSKTKPMVFGNVLFGGVIGAGVDVASGSAYDYPNVIQIPMKKLMK